jgi:hypothetical protein
MCNIYCVVILQKVISLLYIKHEHSYVSFENNVSFIWIFKYCYAFLYQCLQLLLSSHIHNMKIPWMVHHVETQLNNHSPTMKIGTKPNTFTQQNAKTNIEHKTHKNLHIRIKCARISNHQT